MVDMNMFTLWCCLCTERSAEERAVPHPFLGTGSEDAGERFPEGMVAVS